MQSVYCLPWSSQTVAPSPYQRQRELLESGGTEFLLDFGVGFGHDDITVHPECESAARRGAALSPEQITASPTPLSIASIAAITFFCIPKPISGSLAFATARLIFSTTFPSSISPSTF